MTYVAPWLQKCPRAPGEPEGYIWWHEWAEKKSKTHRQKRCEKCGLFHVWVRKKKRR